MSFFEELKRRNVVRVGIAYVIASWLLLQLTEVLVELLDLPDVAGRLVILLLVIGFVPALIFAWAFEMTPDGIKREKEVDRNQSVTKQTGRKLDLGIIAALVVVAAYFFWESRFSEKASESITREPTEQTTDISNEQRDSTAAETRSVQDKSIAVLPFANRSRDEDDEFFSDGMHDDLLTQLAKIGDLKVISRTSVMKYKGTEKTIPEIANELSVTTILEGGIQRAGKRIRINAQLIDVSNDQHLWAETFDREMTVENIFEIQSEIARHIVKAVRGEMTEEEQLNLARVPTTNLQAYESYLQALSLTNRADYAQNIYKEAEIWAQKAVELDPEFAQAWAMLVEIHAQATWLGYDASPERFAMAKTALDNAIRFGPRLPETLAAQAEYQYRIEQDYKKAVETFKTANRALPGDADILHRLAVAQRRAGYLEDAIATFGQAMENDPAFSRSPTTMIETLLFMNEIDRITKLIDQFILRYPDARDLRVHKIAANMFQGDLESARLLVDSMPPSGSSAYITTVPYLPLFERDFDKAIEVWEIPEIAASSENRGYSSSVNITRAWAYRLKGEEALALEHARLVIEKINALPRTGSYIDGFEYSDLAIAYAFIGEFDKALETANASIQIIPEDEDSLFGTNLTEARAQVLGMIGERDEALAEIKRLLDHPTGFNRWQLYLDPRWDFFRDDERFNDLIRPLNLAEASQ